MEKELDINIIKATQSSLGKYIKRPPLNEKLLRKPPFRFLHDIITNVLKNTGFFDGLFNENELISDNVKDRESKILFLNKVITVLALTTGKTLLAKPSKIVAGQEPDKTNELLQCLGQALDKKLTSSEAVKKYKEENKNDNKKEKKDKPESKIKEEKVKVIDKKNTTKSDEKNLKSKKDTIKRVEKNQKDQKTSKSVKTIQPTTNEKEKNTVETKKQAPSKKQPETKNIKENITSENILETQNDIIKTNIIETEEAALETKIVDHSENEVVQENTNANISLTNGSSISNIITKENDDEIIEPEPAIEKEIIKAHTTPDKISDIPRTVVENNKVTNDKINEINIEKESSTVTILPEPYKEKESKDIPDKVKLENISLRPPSVRPSSSRPAAPRLRERHDESYVAPDNLVVGKVNIIVENTPNEEEDESSLILVEETKNTEAIQNVESLQTTSNHHGHLVQQILESQKEFSQIATGKTEIEWEFDTQKAKESSSNEVEQMRLNIEALSRISNPMGKLLDHIQEDVEVMRQELQQWTEQYQQAASELNKQKTVNEESLQPFITKTNHLDADIKEKQEKINDLKVIIYRNTSRINNLLSSGDVQ